MDSFTNNVICIVTKDKVYSALLDLTILEFNFIPLFIEKISEIKSVLQNHKKNVVALFLDLDILMPKVSDASSIIHNLRNILVSLPINRDFKIVFMGSNIAKDLVIECSKYKPFAILLKPLYIPKFVEVLKLLHHEVSFFEHSGELAIINEYEFCNEDQVNCKLESDIYHNYLLDLKLRCPVCGSYFVTKRFKLGKYPTFYLDTDFYPICDNDVHPEIYSIAVCDGCLYANYYFNFEKAIFCKYYKDEFDKKYIQRRELVGNLNFSGVRKEIHSIKAFELAAFSALDLKLKNYLKMAGEFYLKAGWLCRRLKENELEMKYLKKSVDYLQKAFEPYKKVEHGFPTKKQIKSMLQPHNEILSEKGIIILCFLIGEIFRRLGNYDKAKEYFKFLYEIPFFEKYGSLHSHIIRVTKNLEFLAKD